MTMARFKQGGDGGVSRHLASEDDQSTQCDLDLGLEAFDVLGGWRGTNRPAVGGARRISKAFRVAIRWLVNRFFRRGRSAK